MHTYLIERTVPGAGQMDRAALAAISAKSNDVIRDLGSDLEWLHSYVTDDKITCLYRAKDTSVIREHARCGGFPIDVISEIRATIDPASVEMVS